MVFCKVVVKLLVLLSECLRLLMMGSECLLVFNGKVAKFFMCSVCLLDGKAMLCNYMVEVLAQVLGFGWTLWAAIELFISCTESIIWLCW